MPKLQMLCKVRINKSCVKHLKRYLRGYKLQYVLQACHLVDACCQYARGDCWRGHRAVDGHIGLLQGLHFIYITALYLTLCLDLQNSQ